MNKKGTIELFEAKSNKTGKPYTALKLTVGTWTTLYFPDSKFEMDYIIGYLRDDPAKDRAADDFFNGAN